MCIYWKGYEVCDKIGENVCSRSVFEYVQHGVSHGTSLKSGERQLVRLVGCTLSDGVCFPKDRVGTHAYNWITDYAIEIVQRL